MNKLIIALTLVLASYSYADSGTTKNSDEVTVQDGFAATADLLIIRPISTAATVAGFGIFAVSSPFAAMADATDEVS